MATFRVRDDCLVDVEYTGLFGIVNASVNDKTARERNIIPISDVRWQETEVIFR